MQRRRQRAGEGDEGGGDGASDRKRDGADQNVVYFVLSRVGRNYLLNYNRDLVSMCEVA